MSGIRKLVGSEFFIILEVLVGFGIWYYQPSFIISASIIFGIATLILFTQKSSNAMVPLVLITFLSNVPGSLIAVDSGSQLAGNADVITATTLIGILLVEMFVFFFVNKKQDRKPRIWIGILLITISYALSGVREIEEKVFDFRYMDACIMLFLALLYIFFAYTLEKGCESYFAKALLYVGLMVAFQFVTWYIQNYDSVLAGARPNLKWGNCNPGSLILILLSPAGSYLCIKENKYKYFIYSRIILLAIIFSTSRGGMIAGILAFIMTDVYTYRKCSDRQIFKLYYLGSLATVLVAIIATFEICSPILTFILGRFKTDDTLDSFSSGRLTLFKKAIEIFLENPILGIGTVLSPRYTENVWYHSTIFDTLVSLGSVGAVVFLIHFVQKYVFFFKNRKDRFIFLGYVGIICSGLYGLVDVAYYNFIWLSVLFMMLAVLESQSKVKTLPKQK